MPFTGDKYIGDLVLYYIAKKLESGQKSGSVKNAVDDADIDSQLTGGKVNTKTGEIVDDDKMGLNVKKSTQFSQDEISAAMNIADNLLNLPDEIKTDNPEKTFREMERNTEEVKNVEKVVEQFAGPNEITFDFAPNTPVEVVIKDSKGAKDPVYTGVTFDFAPGKDPKDVIEEAKLAVAAGVSASFDVPQTTVEEMGFIPVTPTDDEVDEVVAPTVETVGISNNWNTDGSNIINLNGKRYALFEKDNTFRSAGSEEEFNQILGEGFTPIGNQNPLWLNFAESENLDDIEIIITDETSYDTEDIVTPSSQGESVETSTEVIDFNNVPKGSKLTEVDGNLYLMYAVPGQGQLYTGATMFMAYEVVGNDIFAAGLLTEGASAPTANYSMDKKFFDTVAIVAGNTNEIIGIEDDPFASFVETYSEEAQLRPWLLDPEFIAIQAEAAIENREISDTEWRLTNWYQTHNEAERAWMDLELSDPAEAARQLNDLEIFYENQLSSLGVSGVPDGLVQWISSKNISGQWSDTYTAEQLNLFSDPYKSGDRDAELQNLISTSGFGDVDRTAAREREVVELYRKWLGPTLGSLTQDEVSEIAGRLRDDPDYEDALIQNLKQNRLAAFSNYTNPELTYEDIARPWRNLTTSVWGQTADETQGWWQEMVKTNDFAKAQETLRTKGLEQNVTQVTTDATQALQQALGQGQVSQLGVNV